MLQPNVFSDHESVSRNAADWITERLRAEPAALVCLATGATPMRAYELLAARGVTEPELFAWMQIMKLDEWGGLSMDDPVTCEQHLQRTLVEPLGLADRYIGFNSGPPDPEQECVRIADWLSQNGPIDVCVLGLGINGHLGFNEPAEFLRAHAHVAKLSAASLGHTMLGERELRPRYGLTLGMADVLQSRHILLLVTGKSKRKPLEQLLSGAITTAFPASLLQLHSNVELMCDEAAYATP